MAASGVTVMPRSESGHSGRRDASQLPINTTLRFSPHGTVATLLNISTTGLLARCAVRMSVGSVVTVQFDGELAALAMPSRVARCAVASIGEDGGLRYDVGLAFNTPITLDEGIPAVSPQEPEAAVAAVAPVTSVATEQAIEQPVPVRRNRW
jgi:hypothetical protein